MSLFSLFKEIVYKLFTMLGYFGIVKERKLKGTFTILSTLIHNGIGSFHEIEKGIS